MYISKLRRKVINNEAKKYRVKLFTIYTCLTAIGQLELVIAVLRGRIKALWLKDREVRTSPQAPD